VNRSDSPIYADRVETLIEWMKKQDLNLVLLFDRDNIRYFTGFRLNRVVNSILAISSTDGPTYFVANLDLNRAKRDVWIDRIVPFPEDTPSYLDALRPLFVNGIRCVGLEKDTISLEQAEYLRTLGNGWESIDVRPFTAKMRMIKTDVELDFLRTAANIASDAMEQIRRAILPGMCECQLSSWAEYLMAQAGAEGTSFESFLMSGENSWLPQRFSSRKALVAGEMALLDMGAIVNGYCSDITRTFAVEKVSAEQRRIFEIASEAQQAAIAAVRPGVAAKEVDSAARTIIEDAGLGDFFPHLTGHGVGLSSHEEPIADRGRDTLLEPGMVLTVEPGIYVPGVGAARVEDMVVVTSSGHELLTSASRELMSKKE